MDDLSTKMKSPASICAKPECPVAVIASRAAELIRKHEARDAASLSGDINRSLDKHIFESLENLELAASSVPATSLEGAMFQAMMVLSELDALSEATEEARDCIERRIERLTWSIMSALERASQVSLQAIGADFYIKAELNPFLPQQP